MSISPRGRESRESSGLDCIISILGLRFELPAKRLQVRVCRHDNTRGMHIDLFRNKLYRGPTNRCLIMKDYV